MMDDEYELEPTIKGNLNEETVSWACDFVQYTSCMLWSKLQTFGNKIRIILYCCVGIKFFNPQ